MSQVGERKGNKVQYMIDKSKTQQWGGGGVIAQCYNMVKPCAE